MIKIAKCNTCLFFEANTHPGRPFLGVCGFEPPRWLVRNLQDSEVIDRTVRDDDTCSHHKYKIEVNVET